MVSIKARKISPVQKGKSTLNELESAGTLLDKQKVAPSKDSINKATSKPANPAARRGKLIDILV